MRTFDINTRFEEFNLPRSEALDSVVVIPTVRGSRLLKGTQHSYYFLDFRTLRGLRADIHHLDIIGPGWRRLVKAMDRGYTPASILRCLLSKGHYDFSFLEQLLLMTTPHTVTDLGRGHYIINLWSWFGYLEVDCAARSATFHMIEGDDDQVLGSSQWFDRTTRELYGMSYSLSESFARIADPARSVSCRIFSRHLDTAAERTIWEGPGADYLHDIRLSPNGRFCVSCELGMYRDAGNKTYPSKVMIFDTVTNRHWTLERFIVAAHACFDPDESDVVYFSNHNFQFEHSRVLELMKAGTYAVTFNGPATIFKYRLTPNGPQEIGSFTRSDFYRLTNMHVFHNQGQKLIAAMGFPDQVYLIDAQSMRFVRKICVKASKNGRPSMIGTIAPSPDGNKIFAHTTDAFHAIDIRTGTAELVLKHPGYHTCSNHMIATTCWN